MRLILKKSLDQDSIFWGHNNNIWLHLHFRPVRLWKHIYWAKFPENELRLFAVQTPWVTVTLSKQSLSAGSIGITGGVDER